MLDRKEFVKTHPDVRTGMNVYSTSGEKLGVIERIGEDRITVEKGRIFHKDVSVPFDDIEEVREDDVILRSGGEGREEREERREEPSETREHAGREAEVKVPKRERERETGRYGREEEQARIPLREEEVEVTKRPVVKEESRAGKEARTEEQEVSGEVRKENVTVDRTKPTQKK